MADWNESEGTIKLTYFGFRKHSLGVLQFDTTRNRFLAAGDEFQIKFWDMDNTNILTTIDVEGSSPSPRLRFSKDGSLLAVATNDNGIKILAATNDNCVKISASAKGFRLTGMLESRSFEGTRVPLEKMATKVNCLFHAHLPVKMVPVGSRNK